jgi:hypothetical protein
MATTISGVITSRIMGYKIACVSCPTKHQKGCLVLYVHSDEAAITDIEDVMLLQLIQAYGSWKVVKLLNTNRCEDKVKGWQKWSSRTVVTLSHDYAQAIPGPLFPCGG